MNDFEGMTKAQAKAVAQRVHEEFPTAFVHGPFRSGQHGPNYWMYIDDAGSRITTLEEAEQKIAHMHRYGTLVERYEKQGNA